MLKGKKLIIPFFAATLGILSLNIPNSYATKNTGSSMIIQPQAIEIIEVGKPIAAQGCITNYQLGQMIDIYNKGSKLLNLLNPAIYAAGVTAPAGIVNSIASTLGSGGMPDIQRAFDRGEDMYFFSVYANGQAPSLTTINNRYFSTHKIVFIYYG